MNLRQLTVREKYKRWNRWQMPNYMLIDPDDIELRVLLAYHAGHESGVRSERCRQQREKK